MKNKTFFKQGLNFYLRKKIIFKIKITVNINSVSSLCSSSDLCNFEWLQSSTPTVTNIDTTNQQAIVLTGTGFDQTAANNVVLLGTVQCTVTSATSTQLVCSPGN
jgi:hypothetical protein